MLNQMWTVLIDIVFPKTYLEKYLSSCSRIEMESRLTPRMQKQPAIFAPYHYKDPLVKDCVIELKERCNRDVGRLLGRKIAQWITKIATEIQDENVRFYLVPIPQHISKTKEKGFLHTAVLAEEVIRLIPEELRVKIFPCLEKRSKTARLHDLKGRSKRFKTIKSTMRAHVTRQDAKRGIFFVLDDVFTTGATFKEARRSLMDCGALPEQIFFAAIAH